MLHEHQAGRDFIQGMAAALPGIRKKDPAAVKRFVAGARGYTDLLLAHIDKEDNILYPDSGHRHPPGGYPCTARPNSRMKSISSGERGPFSSPARFSRSSATLRGPVSATSMWGLVRQKR